MSDESNREDELIECRECEIKFRRDEIENINYKLDENNPKCPACQDEEQQEKIPSQYCEYCNSQADHRSNGLFLCNVHHKEYLENQLFTCQNLECSRNFSLDELEENHKFDEKNPICSECQDEEVEEIYRDQKCELCDAQVERMVKGQFLCEVCIVNTLRADENLN